MLRETKLELLEKEGMYEKLWQEIFERAELYEIDRYEKVLKKYFRSGCWIYMLII